ncbi:hypothetical protein EDC02_6332 [Micromonospora sp. Llam0]|uniref:hypothetical protein n=1 Tax=Micromonospora sp. Llam0 TaxID=2485143 RepID=UPI000F907B8B|nr:hypothetical protein [Micromonospora sp. Llam0]ROO51454.1 hypothetical protein EDC02_6332 [Micromonospora sp. Llam0]
MADDNTGTTDQTAKPAGTGGKDWEAEAEKWKALARKHEDQAKANHAELERLKAASDSTKSDMDKVMEKLAEMEKRAGDAERRALIADIAAEKGLTAKQAARLRGDTRDDLLADADELLESFKPAGKDGASGDAGKDGAGTAAAGGDGKASDSGGGDGGRMPPAGTASTATRPKERLTSGAVPAAAADKSPAEMAEAILKSDF